jgi:hypothetical protein
VYVKIIIILAEAPPPKKKGAVSPPVNVAVHAQSGNIPYINILISET